MAISRARRSGITINTAPKRSRSLTDASGLPSPVTNVVATITGNTTATLSWSAPTISGDSAITGYEISGGGTASVVGTTATITGLSANTAYSFTVTPINSVGRGKGNASSSSTTTNWNEATGGTVTTYTSSGITYKVHSFLSSANFVVTSAPNTFDIVYVGAGGAGGAGGGNQHGGGGSGGYGAQVLGINIATGTHSIVIGQPNGGSTTGLGYTGAGGSNGPYMGGWAHSGSTNGPSSAIRTGSTEQYGAGAAGYQYDFGASGTANTGNGGQRGTNTGSTGPGNGGSGIFVIRYRIA